MRPSYRISHLAYLIFRTLRKNTDAIFLHGLVRHAFNENCPMEITGPFIKWDTLENQRPGVNDEMRFRFVFPDRANFNSSVPDLVTAAVESGNEDFVRMSNYAINGKSIYGKTGLYGIAARLLRGGEGTQVTLYASRHNIDSDETFTERLVVYKRFNRKLGFRKMSNEQLDVILCNPEDAYRKGYPPYGHFRVPSNIKFLPDEGVGGECQHWLFTLRRKNVPAKTEKKIKLYTRTLAVVVGLETARKSIYAFGDDCFACKLSKLDALTLRRSM